LIQPGITAPPKALKEELLEFLSPDIPGMSPISACNCLPEKELANLFLTNPNLWRIPVKFPGFFKNLLIKETFVPLGCISFQKPP
jgi:hypothetical protein